MALLALLFCVIIAAAAGLPNRRSTNICETDSCKVVGESIQRSIDKSVDPCTDFYQYACGLWPQNNPIPPNDIEWSTMQLIESRTSLRLKEILEEESNNDELEPIKKLKQYYRSCLDEDAIENQGLEPVQSMIDANGGWPIQWGNQELSTENLTWQEIDNNYLKIFKNSAFFGLSIIPEQEDSSKVIFTLSLDQNSYFEDELVKRSEEQLFPAQNVNKLIRVLKAFKKHKGIETPLENFTADVTELLIFQQNLKNISEHEAEIQKGLKKDQDRMTIAQLQEYYDQAGAQNATAQINWLHVIQEVLKSADKVIDSSYPILVENKHLFHKLAHLLDATPPHVLVNYIQWNLISQTLPFLTKKMRDIEFETTYMAFNIQQKPRWKVCINDISLKDALSVLFVKKYNSTDTITTVTEMLNDIKTEMKERILNSQWTNDNMKTFMTDKIDNIMPLIGYPSWYANETALIERYEGLEIGDNYFKNKMASVTYENDKTFKKHLETINRSVWPLSPITFNAVYIGPLNSMVIPAAAIQDPSFTPGMPLAVNYGAIGMIVGHELAHSFDTTGIEYDKFGNKITSNAETSEAYDERVKCFIDQYSNYTLIATDEDGEPIQLNGLFTKDENVADNIGLEVAFTAFQKRKLAAGPQLKLPGLTDISDEQLFFLSFANMWCMATTEINEAASANVDDHSPNKFRILGTVTNMATFSDAFNCPANSPLNPNTKCTLWK